MGFCEGSPVAFAVARRVQSEGEALPTGVPQVSLAILYSPISQFWIRPIKAGGISIMFATVRSGSSQLSRGD